MKKTILCGIWMGVAGGLWAGDFLSTHRPAFWPGGEFPGATGAVACAQGVLELHYDFSRGGHYVSAQFGLPEKPHARALSLEADFGDSVELTLRVTDATGQTFQRRFPGAPNGWDVLQTSIDASWSGGWGGAADHVVHLPLTGFSVLAENLTQDRPGGAVGVLRIRNVVFSETAVAEAAVLPFKDVPFASLVRRAGQARDELQALVPQLEARGVGAKSRATLSVMDCFFPWILEDVARGFTNRAVREARELAWIGERGASRAREILSGRTADFPVPHYKTSRIDISHAQMIADRQWPDGRVDRGPVMLTGFGHFGTVRRNLHQLPPIGNHILQMEIGPRSILPDEHTVDTNAFRPFFEAAARGAKENVAITLLLSPHYFPAWAERKWPHLKTCGGGFLTYCVYAPEARAVVEKALRAAIPLIRGNPALHSVCLSNEPETHVYAGCPVLRARWPQWLAARYGTVQALNRKLGTSYAAFSEVAMPAGFRKNARSPVLAEFVRFNQAQFAAWHKWMADIIHELAPELPVHSKIMINPCLYDSNATFYSVDPAQFGALSQYNGNDSYDTFRSLTRGWGWSHDWTLMEAGYDYQRSTADLPVFNSENHIQPDRSKDYLPGAHTYAVLWQNAIHGQSATTLWCWERAYDSGQSVFNGLILERPESLEAWAHGALDLSRLADALAPIQNLPPEILVFWSPSAILEGRSGHEAFHRCYRAATFLGHGLGFATDSALEELGRTGARRRPLDAARVILLPDVQRIPAEIQAGLDRFKAAGGIVLPVRTENERALFVQLADRMADWQLTDAPLVRRDGRPVYGVETRGYRRADGRSVLSLCNHLRQPVDVQLEKPGVDLISGAAVARTVTVEPLKPMLIEY
ncbi:MAG: beta-galactosidase [Kiritimatiellia bacterium]